MGDDDVYKWIAATLVSLLFLMLGILDRRRSKQIAGMETKLEKAVSTQEFNTTVKSLRVEFRQHSETVNERWTDMAGRLENIANAMREGQQASNDQIQQLYRTLLNQKSGD